MNACPGCGGELYFDIKTQSLRCPFCNQKKDPGRFAGFGVGADEHTVRDYLTEMDAILYTCPQCGGSIYSAEQSINGFCSYCGSHVMLESRFAKMKYPKYVIPFRIDKEACIEAYRKHIKRAVFAPDEFKDPKLLESFRGIYMSYWGYDITMEGFLYLDGRRSGQNYKCMGWLTAVYDNVFFDASSVFEDHYSEQIAPFDYSAKIGFSPAYLSGFYADMPDLPDDVYEEEALELVKDKGYESTRLGRIFGGMHFDPSQKEKFHSCVEANCTATYTAFFPVWFLSWREKDRVSYAVVNGENGKVACDLPVDFKKFILSGCLIALPLIFLLCILPSFSKIGMVITSESFSLISILLLTYMLKRIVIRNENYFDKGQLVKTGRLNYQYHLKHSEDLRLGKAKRMGIIPLAIVAIICTVPFVFKLLSMLTGGYAVALVGAISLMITLTVLNNTRMILVMPIRGKTPLLAGIWIILASSLYATFRVLSHTAHTAQLNSAVSLQLAGTLLSQFMTLEQYNMLSSRPLKQLNRKGGDINV